MKKEIISILLLSAFINQAQAQDENDALRFGMTQYYGTARGMAIGNATGSVGGDFSTLSVNPSGIGVYRKSEITFTPDFTVSKNEASYLNQTSSDQKSRFNLAQAGIVLTNAKSGNRYKNSAWKTASFGFGLNRLANFSNTYSYTGKNYNNSIVNKWANDFNALGGLNSLTFSKINYSAYAAYQTYLIDKNFAGDTTKAKSYVPAGDGLQQTKQVFETGGMNEIVISGGGNYMEKLMLGATLGITSINYNRTFNFEEKDLSGKLTNDFNYLTYRERLATSGTGINLKVGAIIKANKNLRFGAAFHTPTAIYLNDVSSIEMTTDTDSLLTRNNPTASSITSYNQAKDDTAQAFNYTLYTPYKAIGSATILFNQYGFLTADVEYVDYASMKYNFGSGYETQARSMNQTIQNTYKSAMNVRVGAEAKLQDIYLRAGFAYYGSPYKSTIINSDKTQLSAGIGYRTKTWFIDGTFVTSQQTVSEKPYVLNAPTDVSDATIKNNRSQFLFTLGWKL